MTRRDRAGVALGAVALAVPFLVGWSQADDDGGAVGGRTALRLTDHRIVESSGLVATGGWVVTVNDSGDRGRVFTVDPDTGETVGVTTWAEEPVDVEALAPAGPGHVWVGDIGDNPGDRESIEVRRVPVGPGERTAHEAPVVLTYPDGEGRDAEALLAHPRTGRLYVVTKGVLGGEVHAVPRRPGPGPHPMRQVGRVGGIVTDGAFLDDDLLVLRTYGRAVVHRFPSLEPVGAWDLPEQPQGEGLAVAPDGSLLLSSEGRDSEVLQVEVPADLRRRSLWQLLASLFDR